MFRKSTNFTIDLERETDGRWIAEVHEIPGVMCYGESRVEALAKVEALALRAIADQLEAGEKSANLTSVAFSLAWAIGQLQKVVWFWRPY